MENKQPKDLLNRRTFLGRTAVVAGAASLSFPFVGRNVLGANDRINVACVGVGGKGESDSSHAFTAGGDIIAICDSLEHVLLCGYSDPNATLGKPESKSRRRQSPIVSSDNGSTPGPDGQCPECAKLRQRRATDAARQRKRRAKAGRRNAA